MASKGVPKILPIMAGIGFIQEFLEGFCVGDLLPFLHKYTDKEGHDQIVSLKA